MNLHIGTEVKIRPGCLALDAERRLAFLPGRPMYLTGTVDYINYAHRYYRVRYTMHDRYINHKSFKF